jgi:PKD repeat protein
MIMRNFAFGLTFIILLFSGLNQRFHWLVLVKGKPNKLMGIKKIPKKDRMDLAWQQEAEMTRDPKTGDVPRERLLAAMQYREQLIKNQGLGKAAIPSVNWTERGPNNLGGRTRAICVDLNDPTYKTLWAGGVCGGLWKTTDITQTNPTWVPIDNFFANMAITYIEQSKGNPSVMYFCTGEGNGNSDAVRGLGVWKSTDGGATWAQLASTNNSNFYYCNKVYCPYGPDTVFVCNTLGLYRSTNGGTSFTKVLGSGISSAGGNKSYDIERTFDGTLYTSISSSSSSTGSIHKSTDIGATWSAPLTITGVSRREIELAVSDYDNNTIWGLVENNSTIPAIIKSTNAGVSFAATTAYPVDADGGIPSTDFSRTQAWYDLSIAVDPNNSNVCFVGGVDLFKTSTGGSSWTQVGHWYGGFGIQDVHADQHYALFSPGSSDIAYFSNDGGVYRTANATATVPVISSKEGGYITSQFYAVAVHPTSTNFFLTGAQDNGSHRFNAAGINSTVEVTGGDGAFCHIDQNQPQYQWTSYVYNNYYRSSNSGTSFSNVISSNTGRFINPTDYDDSSNVFYGASGSSTYFRWANPQTGTTTATVTLSNGSGTVTAVKVSPNVLNRVYFAFTGRVVRADNAHTGTSVVGTIITNASIPTSGYINCVEVEKGDENHILITLTNYGLVSVWETKNGGTTWTAIEGNLPDMPIRWIALHPQKSYKAIIATELGVWSTDSLQGAATNWAPTNTGLANVRVDMLQVRSSDRLIAAATHGRGLYTAFLPDYGSNPTFTADFTANNTVAYPTANITFTNASSGATSYLWDFGDGTNSTAMNPVKAYAAGGSYNVTLTINNGAATITKTAYIKILPYRGTPYTLSAGGNFETNPTDFVPYSVAGSGFVRGNSIITGKNGVVSGTNAWVIDPTASQYQDNTISYLYSPSYNLTSNLSSYTLSFYMKNQFELTYDGIRIEYSLNSGTSWIPLGTTVQTSWYDFSNTAGTAVFPVNEAFFNNTNSAYVLRSYNISSLAGNNRVAFRIAFLTDVNTTDIGAAIDDWTISGPVNNPLPVSWASFDGRRISKNEVALNWSTASEKNNQFFEVERSLDGQIWDVLAKVNSKQNSNKLTHYDFIDIKATEDVYYYRIRQVDFDGKSSYSKIISVNAEIESEPIIHKLYYTESSSSIQVLQNLPGDVYFDMVDIHGRILYQNRLLVNNEIPVYASDKGVFIIRFYQPNGKKQVMKIAIQ